MVVRYAKSIMIYMSDSIGRFYLIGSKNECYEVGFWCRLGDILENFYWDGLCFDVIEKVRENMHRKYLKIYFVNVYMVMFYYDL